MLYPWLWMCILLTMCSAINQQIALKTIKKFGFSVNAVWNGREALDYLIAAPSQGKPKPDIILMDVQMPVLDGYRATHLIRTHSPYSSIDGMSAVPIVAMTASAIQGDQEKCRKAGMDDYLAKPVKGKTLEDMLIKWAIKIKRKGGLNENRAPWETSHDSNCSAPKIISASTHAADPVDSTTETSESSGDSDCAIIDASGLAELESEGDREMQRVEAEEKATSLRDDKLLAASNSHIDHSTLAMNTHSRPGPPIAALTEENMDRFDRAHDEAHGPSLMPDENGEELSDSSLRATGRDDSPPTSTVGSLRGPHAGRYAKAWSNDVGGRGAKMKRNQSDMSQKTITQFSLQQ